MALGMMSLCANMSSEFKHHEACPECGSRNNLARYTDGHAWCFGCGHYEPPPMTARIEATFRPPVPFVWPHEASSTKPGVCQGLPDDITNYIPVKCLTWLNKYGIMLSEIKDNCFGWSEEMQRLIMPVYSGSSWMDKSSRGQLLMWEGRYFGPSPEKHAKCLSMGNKDSILHLLDDIQSEAIVLTEDLISAIKVSRQFSAMPLFGSHLSLERIVRLSKITKSLVIWLDDDKFAEALMFRTRASQYIPNVYVVRTPRDPKEYNDDSIYMYITNAVLEDK